MLDYDWNTVAESWVGQEKYRLWRSHSDRVNNMLLFKWLPRIGSERLLKTDLFDEAVGEGMSPAMSSRDYKVFGMDISDRILSSAKLCNPGLKAVSADAKDLPFVDDAFDCVISISTLDHFPRRVEIDTAIGELYRVLKPGGSLIITMDNLANPVIMLRQILPFWLLRRLGILPYYVGKTYLPWRLLRTLKQVGMEVVEMTAIMHCPRIFAVALGCLIEKRLTRKKRGRFLRAMTAFEHLSSLPTKYITGYFTAVKAVKRV